MTRPLSIWLAFIACAFLGLGGLGMVSRHAVWLENDRLLAEQESDRAQRIRLALWRMDSEAAAFLMRENNRPPSDFRKGTRPSSAPPEAEIYFEIDPQGMLSMVAPDEPATKERVRRLLGIGDSPPETKRTPDLARQTFNVNSGIAYAAANFDYDAVLSNQSEDNAEETGQIVQTESKEGSASYSKDSASKTEKPIVAKGKEDADVQQLLQKGGEYSQVSQARVRNQQADYNELSQRAKVVGKSTKRMVLPGYQIESQNDTASEDVPQQTAGGQGSPAEVWLANSSFPDAGVTSFQPVWIDRKLLLVRAVGSETQRRVQGIWLDSAALATSLLGQIQDLLPEAGFLPYEPFVFTSDNVTHGASAADLGETRWKAVPRTPDNAPMALLGLPWELVPGKIPPFATTPATSLHLLLGLAWGGAVLGILAAAVLLRGVVTMSERRGAFVSAVTHELRTPLTTFTLYSEMLADGMVREPAKQQEYLRTLQRESGRLGHLVENVLAYSRLERGSARARMENVDLQSMMDRVMPRIRERAESVSSDLELDLSENLAGLSLQTDVGVVEQILFNLADNAGKYAAPRPGRAPWKLSLHADARRVHLDFRDSGSGIAAGERRRLFRPFHKSAEDAANSKPGVGLGLALSRRLARALGGDLTLSESGAQGSVFRLSLPR